MFLMTVLFFLWKGLDEILHSRRRGAEEEGRGEEVRAKALRP